MKNVKIIFLIINKNKKIMSTFKKAKVDKDNTITIKKVKNISKQNKVSLVDEIIIH